MEKIQGNTGQILQRLLQYIFVMLFEKNYFMKILMSEN